jgi:SAM-dependent methyltransferase
VRPQRLVFGEDAELYDRVRPSYPDDLITDVTGLISDVAGRAGRVLDVGCGTGKAAVLLAQRGLEGVGLEPDARMAAVARRNLGPWPSWRVEVAGFEAWAHDGGGFDLVTCAQAWHWLDPATRLGRAQDLIGPRGWLALWWNRPAEDDSPLRTAMDAVYADLAPQLPPGGPASLPFVLDEIPEELSLGPPIEREYRWSKPYSTEEWLGLLRSSSDHRLLDDDRRRRLLAAVAEVVEAHGGTYRHQYVCRLWAVPRL